MLHEIKCSENKAVHFTAEWGWIVTSNSEYVDGMHVSSNKTVNMNLYVNYLW
jgi:hypothetical protein